MAMSGSPSACRFGSEVELDRDGVAAVAVVAALWTVRRCAANAASQTWWARVRPSVTEAAMPVKTCTCD
ncbi:hypothetical protein A4V12_18240 [Streptomyces noursei]|nr:hypothetical protein A4V12_18240 [Streptomyces noursei]